MALETSRREYVGDRMADKGYPDRFRDLPGAGFLARPVAIDCRVAGGSGELVGSFTQDDVDTRVGRPNEGREKLRRGG